MWALVHGLAFLHLDSKLDSSTPETVAAQVASAVHALFNAAPAMSGPAAAAQPPGRTAAVGPPTTVSRSTTKTSVEPAGISAEGDCLP